MFQLCHERHTHTDWSIEDREIKTTELTIDAEVLYRDDGFKLIRLGKKWRYDGYFRYEKSGLSFEFRANRTHPGGTITGTYCVFLEFKRGQRLGDALWPLPRSRVEEIAADIYAALCAWPTPQQQENIPVGVVSFTVSTFGAVPGNNPEATSNNGTQYEFTLGHPVTLRDVPPSTRWQRRLITYRGGDKWRPDVVREREALIRDDGIRLIRFATMKGPADDGPDTYRYVEGDVSFDFYAERRVGRGLMTDTWEVQLDPDPRRHATGLSSELRTRLGPDRCAEVVGNIEEAFYAWPQLGYEYETPTNRVIFLDAQSLPQTMMPKI